MSAVLSICQSALEFQFIQSLIHYLPTKVTPPPICSFLVNDHISYLIMKASRLRVIYVSVSPHIPHLKFCHFWIGGTSFCYPTCTKIIHAHIYIILQLANAFNWPFLSSHLSSLLCISHLRAKVKHKNTIMSLHEYTSLVAQLVKNPPAMWETWVWYLGWEDPLEKGKATQSSILAWRISWTV